MNGKRKEMKALLGPLLFSMCAIYFRKARSPSHVVRAWGLECSVLSPAQRYWTVFGWKGTWFEYNRFCRKEVWGRPAQLNLALERLLLLSGDTTQQIRNVLQSPWNWENDFSTTSEGRPQLHFEDESETERKLEGKRRCGGRLDKLGIGSCKASPACHCSLYLIRTSADRAATAILSVARVRLDWGSKRGLSSCIYRLWYPGLTRAKYTWFTNWQIHSSHCSIWMCNSLRRTSHLSLRSRPLGCLLVPSLFSFNEHKYSDDVWMGEDKLPHCTRFKRNT